MYLRSLAGKTADDILNRLCQIAALLPQTYQEGIQLLTPRNQEKLIYGLIKTYKTHKSKKEKISHSIYQIKVSTAAPVLTLPPETDVPA